MWDTSDWIAVAALLVATISAVLTIIARQDQRDARPDPLRAAVYEQQSRLTLELVGLVRASHLALVDPESTDADHHFEANERMVEFVRTAAFLPPAVVEAARIWLTETSKAIEANADSIAAALLADGQTDAVGEPLSFHEKMDEAFYQFTKRIDKETGTGRLYREVRELIGVAKVEREERDRAASLRRLDAIAEIYEERLQGRQPPPE